MLWAVHKLFLLFNIAGLASGMLGPCSVYIGETRWSSSRGSFSGSLKVEFSEKNFVALWTLRLFLLFISSVNYSVYFLLRFEREGKRKLELISLRFIFSHNATSIFHFSSFAVNRSIEGFCSHLWRFRFHSASCFAISSELFFIGRS